MLATDARSSPRRTKARQRDTWRETPREKKGKDTKQCLELPLRAVPGARRGALPPGLAPGVGPGNFRWRWRWSQSRIPTYGLPSTTLMSRHSSTTAFLAISLSPREDGGGDDGGWSKPESSATRLLDSLAISGGISAGRGVYRNIC